MTTYKSNIAKVTTSQYFDLANQIIRNASTWELEKCIVSRTLINLPVCSRKLEINCKYTVLCRVTQRSYNVYTNRNRHCE